jgi:hypothetical protein
MRSLLLATLLATLAWGAGKVVAAPTHRFQITIDRPTFEKFGLRYPATYVFRVSGATADWRVRRADKALPEGRAFEKRRSGKAFSGVEAVRLDVADGRMAVSTGFAADNAFELQLIGFDNVSFEGVAKYYDRRRAAVTLSNDNWGCNPWAHPGAPWRGATDDASDNYQAAVHVCRDLGMPVTVAVNSRMAGGDACWRAMQAELDRGDRSWEPAVHGWTHPNNAAAYNIHGYRNEILGCRDDLLTRLRNIPYGPHVYEHILTYGYIDDDIQRTGGGEFLFLRGFNWNDNPGSCDFAPHNAKYKFYGVGGLNTVGYDRILERREPKGRFHAADVAELNAAFDAAHRSGGIFYGLWHPDRFRNSVVYDPRPGVEGREGSTLLAHLRHVAGRPDVWYVANGWLYSYRYVAEHVRVKPLP